MSPAFADAQQNSTVPHYLATLGVLDPVAASTTRLFRSVGYWWCDGYCVCLSTQLVPLAAIARTSLNPQCYVLFCSSAAFYPCFQRQQVVDDRFCSSSDFANDFPFQLNTNFFHSPRSYAYNGFDVPIHLHPAPKSSAQYILRASSVDSQASVCDRSPFCFVLSFHGFLRGDYVWSVPMGSSVAPTTQAAQEALKQLTTERVEGEPLPEIQVRSATVPAAACDSSILAYMGVCCQHVFMTS